MTHWVDDESACAVLTLVILLPVAADARMLTREEQDVLVKISDAYNTMQSLEAGFVQIGPDGQMSEGRVYIKKPGEMRFEYAPPAPTLVICDGLDIAVFNLKLHTVDRYPLSVTPLNLLLSDQLNLAHSNAVVGVERQAGSVTIDARSNDRRVTGDIAITFTDPGYELRQWTVTDAQGLTTTVTLRNLHAGVELQDSIFSLKGNKTGN